MAPKHSKHPKTMKIQDGFHPKIVGVLVPKNNKAFDDLGWDGYLRFYGLAVLAGKLDSLTL